MPGPGRFTWKCLFMKRNLAALQLYLKVDFEGFFIVFTHCVSLLTRWRHIFKKKKMTLFKYGTKLAFKKMGFIFLPPFHLSSPHSLFKTIFSLIIILNFLMGVSSEKIFVRPKSFWERCLLLYWRDESARWKGTLPPAVVGRLPLSGVTAVSFWDAEGNARR